MNADRRGAASVASRTIGMSLHTAARRASPATAC
jgi:hypothetical protein